ncbi:MAG: RsmE family RNA methyltransferase [bacterium]|nr:RsmE family RNA methyltransferase [bacterium]
MVKTDRGEFALIAPGAVRSGAIELPPDEAHHAFRVRRVAAGDELWVTDGAGRVFRCRVESFSRLRVMDEYPELGEPKYPVVLGMAILKGDANRDVVDVAVQLGVTRILFFPAERSEGRFAPEKLERLARAAVSAVKQTGRARLPEIALKKNLAELFENLPERGLRLLAHPCERDANPCGAFISCESALLVGPEGGFSASEIEQAQRANFRFLTLGRRRLRSPLAVAAGLTWILSGQGECGGASETSEE